MNKTELVKVLKERHGELRGFPDSEVVSRFNICTRCGTEMVGEAKLDNIIQTARNIDHFYQLYEGAHTHKH